MKKRIVILTKSDKCNDYCVAGIDMDSGKWVRLENRRIIPSHALNKRDLICEDGTSCEELDIVEADCLTENAALLHQPENIYIDERKRFKKIGRMTWKDLIDRWGLPVPEEDILNSRTDRIQNIYIERIKNKRSLQFISAEQIHIEPATQRDDGRYKHSKVSFTYRNKTGEQIKYRLTITDPEYYPQMEERYIDQAYMIISLGMEFKGCYYLLAAKIIEDVKEPLFVTESSKTGIKYYHCDENCGLLKYIGYDSAQRYSMGRIMREKIQMCRRCGRSRE